MVNFQTGHAIDRRFGQDEALDVGVAGGVLCCGGDDFDCAGGVVAQCDGDLHAGDGVAVGMVGHLQDFAVADIP